MDDAPRRKAVALKYDERFPAPFVLAKGAGRLAQRIEAAAAASGVTVSRRSDLADELFTIDIGGFIPEQCFQVVAELLAFVGRIEKKTQR